MGRREIGRRNRSARTDGLWRTVPSHSCDPENRVGERLPGVRTHPPASSGSTPVGEVIPDSKSKEPLPSTAAGRYRGPGKRDPKVSVTLLEVEPFTWKAYPRGPHVWPPPEFPVSNEHALEQKENSAARRHPAGTVASREINMLPIRRCSSMALNGECASIEAMALSPVGRSSGLPIDHAESGRVLSLGCPSDGLA
jgi:hypothetical protein